ncbi:MAG: DMT family transporter [Bacteroidota bacterium]
MNIYVIIFIQILFSGATHIVAKTVVRDVDALTITFLRAIISSVGLAVLMKARGRVIHIRQEDRLMITLLAVLATGNQILYLYGIKFTTAANAALLYAVTPIFVLILSRFVLKEQLTLKKSAGVVLAFLGVTIVIFERGVDFSSDYFFGNLMILIAVVAWALFTILGRPMVLRYGAVQTISVASFVGCVLLVPFGVYSSLQFPFSTLTEADWVGIFYLGVGTSILSYLLWYYALQKIEASKLAVFANGQPILATILSMIFLDYTLTAGFLLGGAITICGVVLAQLRTQGTFR